MRQEKRKERDKAALALVLCFSVVAIAAVFTVKSSIDKINLQNQDIDINPIEQIGELSDANIEEQPVTKPIPTVDSQDNTGSGEGDAGQSTAKSEYIKPLSGSIITEFSSDAPVYSVTLDQYMTHYGVDIAADLDTQVKAVASGTVTKVYTDDKYGITIEINHGNGYQSVYSNLSTTSMVEVSDVVEQGQVISGVGSTALFETLEPNHLHFEIHKDGIPIDPQPLIGF